MTIYWSGDGELALSNPLLQAPLNAADETIQLSKDEDFSTTIDLSVEKGVRSRQFLCEELNSLLGRLGYIADEKDRKSTRLNSSHANISYAVFCLKKKKSIITITTVLPITDQQLVNPHQ